MELLKFFAADADWWTMHESASGGLLQPVKFFVEPSLRVEIPGYGSLDLIACAFILILLTLFFTVSIRLLATRTLALRLSGIALLVLGAIFLYVLYIYNLTLANVKLGILISTVFCVIIGAVWAALHARRS